MRSRLFENLTLNLFQVGTSYSSPDLKTLRERLLKQVVISNAASLVPKAKPNQKKSIFAERKYLTNNFILADSPHNKEVSVQCSRQVPYLLTAMHYTWFFLLCNRRTKSDRKFIVLYYYFIYYRLRSLWGWCSLRLDLESDHSYLRMVWKRFLLKISLQLLQNVANLRGVPASSQESTLVGRKH
jgi:hypothetical protein